MTTNFEFIVPSATGAFNVQALPNYVAEADTPDQLLDVKSTLKALAFPECAADNLQKIYLNDLDKYLPPADEGQKTAMDIVKGKWSQGFGLSVIKAEDGGKATYLYAIEDQVRKKMVVLGDADIGLALSADLAKDGLTYLYRGDPKAARAINDFLADGVYARYRQKKPEGESLPQPPGTIESLILSFAAVGGIETSEDMRIPKGSTVGQIMQNSRAEPSVYVSIVKPKRI